MVKYTRKKKAGNKWRVTKKAAGGVAGSGWTRKDIQKELMKIAETKRFTNAATGFSSQQIANSYVAYNLLYWIPSGSNESSKIGDEIFLESFDLNIMVNIDRSTNAARPNPNEPYHVWVGVVRANEEVKDGTIGASVTPVTFGDIRYGATGSYTNPVIDGNKYTVLWSEVMRFPPATLTNNNDSKQLRRKVKVNQKFKYKDTSAGYGKFFNYYLVFANNSPSANQGAIYNPSYVVNFKDM